MTERRECLILKCTLLLVQGINLVFYGPEVLPALAQEFLAAAHQGVNIVQLGFRILHLGGYLVQFGNGLCVVK